MTKRMFPSRAPSRTQKSSGSTRNVKARKASQEILRRLEKKAYTGEQKRLSLPSKSQKRSFSREKTLRSLEIKAYKDERRRLSKAKKREQKQQARSEAIRKKQKAAEEAAAKASAANRLAQSEWGLQTARLDAATARLNAQAAAASRARSRRRS